MTRFENYVFVLWADRFEEVAAAIFAAEFRQAGLRVKVVGLSQQRTSGSYGLILIPDLTLEQALAWAAKACCVVIPCPFGQAGQLKIEPRLHHFFYQAQVNKAKFVIGPDDLAPDRPDLFTLTMEDIIVYPQREHLVLFARELASSLLEEHT